MHREQSSVISLVIAIISFVTFPSAYRTLRQSKETGHLFPIVQNGKWGYIDVRGEVVIKPQFRMAFEFSEGLAPVVIGTKFGYVNERGVVVINPQYDEAMGWSRFRGHECVLAFTSFPY